MDADVPCAPPYCTGDRRRSVSAMDWNGATRHWVFVPFSCYYHLYAIQDVGCCAARLGVKWALVMGDSPVREIFGNMLNFNGSTERYAKFDAIDSVGGLPPPFRLTFQFWHSSYFMSSEYEALRGGPRARKFDMDAGYLRHFNVLPSADSGKPWRVDGLHGDAPPMRVPSQGAEHLFSGLETDSEAGRPAVYVANGALVYSALYNSLDTVREWARAFARAVAKALPGDASLGAKGAPMRAQWVRGPAVFGSPHGAAESVTLARASLFDYEATQQARAAGGWELLDALAITQTRWEDAWDGVHLLREANGDVSVPARASRKRRVEKLRNCGARPHAPLARPRLWQRLRPLVRRRVCASARLAAYSPDCSSAPYALAAPRRARCPHSGRASRRPWSRRRGSTPSLPRATADSAAAAAERRGRAAGGGAALVAVFALCCILIHLPSAAQRRRPPRTPRRQRRRLRKGPRAAPRWQGWTTPRGRLRG
jgi:hypothetical protein